MNIYIFIVSRPMTTSITWVGPWVELFGNHQGPDPSKISGFQTNETAFCHV